jgi:hypothetical protein
MNATGFSSLHTPYRRSPARRVAFWCLPCAVFCLVAVDATRLVADWTIATCSQSGYSITVYLNSVFGQGNLQLAWENYYNSTGNLEYENQLSPFSLPANSTNYPASTGDVTNGDHTNPLTTYVFVEPLHGGDKYCPNSPFPTQIIRPTATSAFVKATVPAEPKSPFGDAEIGTDSGHSKVRQGSFDVKCFNILHNDVAKGAVKNHYTVPFALYSLNNYSGKVTMSYWTYWYEGDSELHLICRDPVHAQYKVSPSNTLMNPIEWKYDVKCPHKDSAGEPIPANAHIVVRGFAGNADQGIPLRVEFDRMQ